MSSNVENRAYKQLLWIGIGSISMFFAGLTSAFIVRKAEGNWMEFSLPDWFWFSTITIIISSLLLIVAQQRIKKDKSILRIFSCVFFIGLIFAFFQLNGWQELTERGVYLTGKGSNVAGSFLYILTLSHLVHLVGGLVALLVVIINIIRKKYSSSDFLGVDLASLYWHFLTILWIYLFFFLKYL